jgi:predicted esterase
LATALVACGDDGSGDGGGAAEGSDAGGALDAGSCDLRCGPEQSLRVEACECTSEGARMRLAALDQGFYAQPWPLATRLRDDGTLDLDGFPTPANATFIVANLPTIASKTHGFSTNGAIFASFDGALDPETLPSATESLEDGASAYLVEVEPGSATRGERTPITCGYREAETDYNPPHLLACAPFPGFPLRPATSYALVLTDALLDAEGEQVRASQRLRDALHGSDEGDDALTAQLIDAYAPLADFLLTEDGALAHVVGGTVFTTQDPTAELRALAAAVQALEPPAATDVREYEGTLPAESGSYVALDGTYDTPIYQQGQTPYQLLGGEITFEPDGTPIQNGTLPLRFALSVPTGAMPAGGWPVALYHHGTAGDAYTFIENGTAEHLAQAGVAMIGIDAPVHGTRRPAGVAPDLLFFNVTNVLAMRDNIRQGAVDLLVLERFVEAFALAAGDSPTGDALRFDPERIFAMGHSQGGLTVPLMLPLAKHVKGAMLSGAGASIVASILYKTAPTDIPALARAFLALQPDEPLDVFHPVLALVQAFSDVSDSTNYLPYLYRWEGGRGVDVWATQGLLDTYAPKPVTDVLVTALGLSPLDPLVEPVEGLTLRGLSALPTPLRANVESASGGTFTAAYSQYPNDDHFLIEDDPEAEAQLRHWFETLAHDGHGELLAP